MFGRGINTEDYKGYLLTINKRGSVYQLTVKQPSEITTIDALIDCDFTAKTKKELVSVYVSDVIKAIDNHMKKIVLPETTEKDLIVNGSLNPSLTRDEILKYYGSKDHLVSAAWNIIVKLTSSYRKQFISKDLFPSYDELCKNPRELFLKVWSLKEKAKEIESTSYFKNDYNRGVKLYEFFKNDFYVHSKSFDFSSPQIPMNYAQALGYLSKQDSFNQFKPYNMVSFLKEIKKLNIFADHGINNPNTGRDITTIIHNRSYYYISFNFTKNQSESFFNSPLQRKIEFLAKNTKADSIRWEIGENKREIILVLFWD